VTEKEALQNAADEARKAARAGREFASLLDDYAKYLTQPNWRQRADDTYRSALNKLNVINEGLAACHKIIEAGAEAAAADSLQRETLRQTELLQERESEAIATQEIAERSKPRSIRIAKKAVGT
jgi:hypothetical protein